MIIQPDVDAEAAHGLTEAAGDIPLTPGPSAELIKDHAERVCAASHVRKAAWNAS
jgi:hypothetical protein